MVDKAVVLGGKATKFLQPSQLNVISHYMNFQPHPIMSSAVNRTPLSLMANSNRHHHGRH